MSEYIICYDISHPKRLGQVFRHLKKYAVPLQHSVFLFIGDERQLDCCMEKAAQLIDSKDDDLRAYPLPARGLRVRLGKAILPAGVYWSGLPTVW